MGRLRDLCSKQCLSRCSNTYWGPPHWGGSLLTKGVAVVAATTSIGALDTRATDGLGRPR